MLKRPKMRQSLTELTHSGYAGPSFMPRCVACSEHTRSMYTTRATAIAAARLLGWIATPRGYVCDGCRAEARNARQGGGDG